MGAAIDTGNGHAPPRIHRRVAEPEPRTLQTDLSRLEPARAFAAVVLHYLLAVLPSATRELAGWRARAAAIPSPSLRRHALAALRKRGNIEGAALFATLAPRPHRRETVRALVAFQTAYNYLDALSELPCEDPARNADRLHQALLTALHPATAAHPDHYAHHSDREDGGFLHAMTDACGCALARLPSEHAAAAAARSAAARIVRFQALNLTERQGGHDALRRWALDTAPAGSQLTWWETAAAAGSSLAVHALIAAAAQPELDPCQACEIERAYHPIGALHSLLDSLVDRREDRDGGRRSLLDHYESPPAAVARLAALAGSASQACERLERPHMHRVILTAMCSYYLSAPECDTGEAQAVARALERALGSQLRVALAMFRCRRLLHTLACRAYA